MFSKKEWEIVICPQDLTFLGLYQLVMVYLAVSRHKKYYFDVKLSRQFKIIFYEMSELVNWGFLLLCEHKVMQSFSFCVYCCTLDAERMFNLWQRKVRLWKSIGLGHINLNRHKVNKKITTYIFYNGCTVFGNSYRYERATSSEPPACLAN